jgi:hypothetical protein
MLERVFMDRHKRFAVFLILILLLATLVAVSHRHENTTDDHDCPICIANDHQSATDHSTGAFDITPHVTETSVVVSAPALNENLLVASCSTRGPPA